MSNIENQLQISDYDTAWPGKFSVLSGRVRTLLGPLVIEVEHIGSTAVPGLAAKPVIDIDVVLASLSDLPDVIRRLGVVGYVHEGELGVAGRHAFLWPPGEERHHLYVLAAGAPELCRHLAFRDALRANQSLRSDYAALKRELARRYPRDRNAYTEAKTAFIALSINRR